MESGHETRVRVGSGHETRARVRSGHETGVRVGSGHETRVRVGFVASVLISQETTEDYLVWYYKLVSHK